MGEALAGIGLAIQLAPLLRLGYRKLHLICSRAQRNEMLMEYYELEHLYAAVRRSVRNLEGELQKQFTRRMRQVRKSLKWLSAMAVESSSKKSRRGRFKQRLRKCIVFLCGSSTLEMARDQMERVQNALRSYEVRLQDFHASRIIGILDSVGEVLGRVKHIVWCAEQLIVRNQSEHHSMATTSHPSIRRSSSRVVRENMDTQFGTRTVSAEDPLDTNSSVSDGIPTGCVSALNDREDMEPELSDEADEDVSMPARHMFDTDLYMDVESLDSGETSYGEEQADADLQFSDNGEDGLYETDPMLDSSSETHSEHTIGTDGGDRDEGSVTDDRNIMEPTLESLSDNDDAESHTSSQPNASEDSDPQPGPAACAHSDVSLHAWNWSLIVYASAGIRRRCRVCGTQWTKAEFSSLLERNESGGAELNWQHISGIRWWPGGSWSWQ